MNSTLEKTFSQIFVKTPARGTLTFHKKYIQRIFSIVDSFNTTNLIQNTPRISILRAIWNRMTSPTSGSILWWDSSTTEWLYFAFRFALVSYFSLRVPLTKMIKSQSQLILWHHNVIIKGQYILFYYINLKQPSMDLLCMDCAGFEPASADCLCLCKRKLTAHWTLPFLSSHRVYIYDWSSQQRILPAIPLSNPSAFNGKIL